MRSLPLIFVSAAMAWAGPAAASEGAESSASSRRPPPTDWVVLLGGGALVTPDFSGAEDYKVRAVPYIDIRYKDVFFANPNEGIGLNLAEGDLSAGPVVKWRFKRSERDSVLLQGLGSVGFTVEPGVFAEYKLPAGFRLKAEAFQGIGGHKGFNADLALDYTWRLGPFFVAVGPRVNFADAKFNRAYYGVTPAQAARSRYRVYEPGGGVRSIGAGGVFVFPITQSIGGVIVTNYARLMDGPGRSPFVQTRDSFTGIFALSYRFGF
jgi:MipA family protein